MTHHLLFLTCPPREALELVDELTESLEAQGVQVQSLLYGVTPKCKDGVVVLACPQSFPRDFLARIGSDPGITDYIVCAGPSDDEGEATTPYAWQHEANVATPVEPPPVPHGFVARAASMPLISPQDGFYVARVAEVESDAEGILFYEGSREVVFLSDREGAACLLYLLQEARSLLSTSSLELQAHLHEQLRSLWWAEETRKTRAVVDAHFASEQEGGEKE